ncbi:putative heavy metal ion-transporting ATPase (plasmid) [Selenomonas ruminantium subsp. lactilytica TAM6421]|uniref:Cd(2+)-exporting ATPase n=1 Tax=Selenomonas ruminantium subsp. lactilytica (strain NBRC 103574 / TAM6421) TaxID=927704 RepID=I0GVM5_SELRL|nr:heavy metal translocating P-type ATPase [Selenomonas ruminantium]BAL84812.1 putative heavy metal ion-transporting ATPase [Selenomonas ruminantium subsp. lactilytica TAM6421]
MNNKQKKNLIRIILAAVMLIALSFAPLAGGPRFAAYLVPYLIVGYDILYKAGKGIKNRKPFDESLLMAIATLGAMALAIYEDGDYTEAIAVMLFYQVGEWFQAYAVGRSRRDISELMDIRPNYANLQQADGSLAQVDPDEVEIGSIIVVKPGEKIPLDGVVVEGFSSLNTVALTGESLPREVREGDDVISGCISSNGLLKIRTTKDFDESTASKILEMVEDASSRKSRSENFIARFARVYTPIVVYAALALAFLPPLVRFLGLGLEPAWGTWIYRALTFLVISCPCALVVSIPLSFFAGIGGASRQGVLVKGSNYLETLADVDTVVFDKTGTLTKGVFAVNAIHTDVFSREELLHLAAHVERYSTHPIAESLRAAFGQEADGCAVEQVEEIAGQGIRAQVNGRTVHVGNDKLMDDIGAEWHECDAAGTMIHVAVDGVYAGHIIIADVVKEHASEAIRALKRNGISRTIMLTGDSSKVANKVAAELQLDDVYSQLLPQDKVAKVEVLLQQQKQGRLAFVGDGINDAPVLSRADVGIAMGAMGSDAAIEAADIVLMDDDPLKISVAQRIARKTIRIVKQNIYFSIGIKVLVLLLGAVGLANMWAAIFADVGVMVLAVLNAVRAMFVPKASLLNKENGRSFADATIA